MSASCCDKWGLLAEVEPLDEAAVLVRVLIAQVIEQLAPLAHQLEQPAPRVEILDVRLEMLGEAVDALGEERDLHLGRAGVGSRALVLLHYLRFLRNLQCHSLSLYVVSYLEGRHSNRTPPPPQGLPMFFSRLGEPEGPQGGAVAAPQPDHRAARSVDAAQAFRQ